MTTLLDSWLTAHGLSSALLSSWHVKTTPTSIHIPVYSLTGKVAYVLVRSLTSDVKYRVTPEHAKKGMLLYGLNRALPSINRMGYAVVVEGWSDVLALHAAGVSNAIGIIGSSITNVQAALLTCITTDVVAIGDGDEAGEKMISSIHKSFTGRVSSIIIDGIDPSDAVAAGLNIKDLTETAAEEASSIQHRKVTATLELIEMVTRADGYNADSFDQIEEDTYSSTLGA